jgi:hypothetical protein
MRPPSSLALATPRGGCPPTDRQSRIRGGKLGWLLCVAAVISFGDAWAQNSDRQFQAGREADFDQWRWVQAQRGRTLTDGERAVQAVTEAMTKRDCTAAASALNTGLGKSYPEVWLLAGAMFEDGLCLKPSWDRAVDFYQRADNAGQPAAALRLAAGYATPGGGRDLAAALWWAARGKTPLPAACASATALANEPDRFVAALKAWPAGQLEGCAYAAAVMATLQGEFAGNDLASALGLEGRVRITFVPAEARIDIDDDLAAAGGVAADAAVREAQARTMRTALQQQLRAVADRALKRHVKPTVVPASWRVDSEQVLRVAR